MQSCRVGGGEEGGEGGAEGAVCPRASGSSGPHQLISKFLFIASLHVFKEPPIRFSLQGSKSPPQIPLLPAPSARFDHRHKGRHFAVLPLGFENLSILVSCDLMCRQIR